MAGTIKQRLRRYNGTDYDTVHLETDGDVVDVDLSKGFTNPLNTDQLTLGQTDVYFTAYPDIKWCVDHIDGDYVYLGGYNISETAKFDSKASSTYSGSTIAAKCTDYLNNTIPNVAQYLVSMTVEGVTNKVFIPTYYQMSGNTGYGDTSGPVFSYPSASAANRRACYPAVTSNGMWLSTASSSGNVWHMISNGAFSGLYPSNAMGFRPEVKVRYKADPVIKDLNTTIGDIGTEIDTLKTSVSEGKALIAEAVTDKGVETASDATFQTMADNINAISSGGYQFGNGKDQISSLELHLCGNDNPFGYNREMFTDPNIIATGLYNDIIVRRDRNGVRVI